MQKNKELAVIIPVYNEEEIIQTVIKEWDKKLKELNIGYVIAAYNDGSKDQSLKKLNELQLENLKIIDKKNSGHGPTIIKGYLDHLDYEWLFQVDSDHELRPEDFSKLWLKRKDYDFLVGKRINRHSPLPRQIMTFISSLTIKIFYGFGMTDVNIPFRLMRVSKFQSLFTHLQNIFAPNVIISGFACLKNLKIYQIDVPFYERQTGEVSIQKWKLLKVALKSFIETIRCRFLI